METLIFIVIVIIVAGLFNYGERKIKSEFMRLEERIEKIEEKLDI